MPWRAAFSCAALTRAFGSRVMARSYRTCVGRTAHCGSVDTFGSSGPRQTARCGCLSRTFGVCVTSRSVVALVEQGLPELVEGPEGVGCGRGHGIAAALVAAVNVSE